MEVVPYYLFLPNERSCFVGNENTDNEHTKVTATAISIYTPVAIVSPVTDDMCPYTPKRESNTRNT